MGGWIEDGYTRRVEIGKTGDRWPVLAVTYRPLVGRDKPRVDRVLSLTDGRAIVDAEAAATVLADVILAWSFPSPCSVDVLLDKLPLERFTQLVNVVVLGGSPDADLDAAGEPVSDYQLLEDDAKN